MPYNPLQTKPLGQKPLSFAADERTNSILLSGERTQRLKTRMTIAHLDSTGLVGNEGDTQVIYLKYAKAEDIATILNSLQQSSVQAAEQSQDASAKPEVASTIQFDEATNAIIITASAQATRDIKNIIRQLDIRRAQVLVEAIIAEISTNKANELGTLFAIDGTNNGTAPIGVSNLAGINLNSAIQNPASAITGGLSL